MARLRDQELAEFVTATAATRPAGAADQWVIVIEDGAPVSAIAPGTVVPPGAALPPVVVAAADLDVNTALTSAAFDDIGDVGAVVVADGAQVAGVWAGQPLAEAVLRGPVRSTFRGGLPGPPATIPLISRSCTFADAGTVCATAEQFTVKPYPMPACRNDQGLAAHQFGW
jgi:hypothetical protein